MKWNKKDFCDVTKLQIKISNFHWWVIYVQLFLRDIIKNLYSFRFPLSFHEGNETEAYFPLASCNKFLGKTWIFHQSIIL